MKRLAAIRENKGELVDSLYLVLLQGVNQLLPLFVLPYLLVRLGAEGYGYVGFSLSVVQYVMLVVDFGFNLSATKHIAQVRDNRQEMSRVFWNVAAAKTLLLLAATITLGVLIAAVSTFRLYGKAILATLPMAVGSTFTFMWLFQGLGKVRMFSVMNTLSKVALLPLIFLFVKSPDDYLLAAFLQAAVFVSTALISNVYLYRKRMVAAVRPTWAGIKDEVRKSFPLFLSTASTSVYTQLVVIVLGFFCTTAVVGAYSSADRIMRAVCFLLYVPLNQVFFPKISAFATANRNKAMRLFAQVRLLVVVVMGSVSAALFFGGRFLPLLLGSDYAGIETYLCILAPAPLFIGIGGVYGQMGLVALGNERTARQFRNVYFAAAAVSVTLMFALTPWLRAEGACIAVTATEAAVCLLMAHCYRRYARGLA